MKYLKNILLFFLIFFLPVYVILFCNDYSVNINYFTIFAYITLILIFILTYYDKRTKSYPLILFCISLSLTLSRTMLSSDIVGSDARLEYYYSQLVYNTSFWDLTIKESTNSVLSVTLLPPILSKLTGASLVMVYKFLYPVIFSFTPVMLYFLYCKFLRKTWAFLSVFFYISLNTFYAQVATIGKQMIGEFFLILILIILYKFIESKRNNFILFILTLGLAFSHYAMSTLWIIVFIISIFILSTFKINLKNKFSPYYFVILIITTFAWDYLIASAISFDNSIYIFKQIISNFWIDFLDPSTIQPLALLDRAISTAPILRTVFRGFNMGIQFLIILGLFKMVISPKRRIIDYVVACFAISMSLLWIVSSIVPWFSVSMGFTRIYQVSLIALSPCVIFGTNAAIDVFYKISNKRINVNKKLIIYVILTVYFAYQSGIVYEVAGSPTSPSLNLNVDYTRFNEADISNGLFIMKYNSQLYELYSDLIGSELFYKYYGYGYSSYLISSRVSKVPYSLSDDTLLFLRTYNLEKNEVLVVLIPYYSSSIQYYDLNYYDCNYPAILSDFGASKLVKFSN